MEIKILTLFDQKNSNIRIMRMLALLLLLPAGMIFVRLIFSKIKYLRCSIKDVLSSHNYLYSTNSVSPRRIFSGIQPTGSVHLGNYFGAIKQWVGLQDCGWNGIYCIVDLHSITLPQEPEVLQRNILKMTATLLACGIDPTKSIIYQQSMVPQHAELCWVLGCSTTMARLSHLPQFKEKSENLKEIPLGIYIYPVLQAADILLYKATHVPVGEDQAQHLQLAQHLAQRFNKRYGKIFPLPKAMISDDATSRLRSLRDPTKKMSKSDVDSKSRIELTDSPEAILEKCKKALTDFTSEITFEPEVRPGVANLLTIHSLFSGKLCEDLCLEFVNLDTARYKLKVAEVVQEKLEPIRESINGHMSNPEHLVRILEDGARRATAIAEDTWSEVKKVVGLKL